MNKYIYNKNEAPENTPNLFQMLRSFSKELVNYIKQGAPNVTPEDYADRLDTCSKCPHIKLHLMRCGICGCSMENKAKWKTATCPDNPERWEPQIIPDDKKQENNNTDSSTQT